VRFSTRILEWPQPHGRIHKTPGPAQSNHERADERCPPAPPRHRPDASIALGRTCSDPVGPPGGRPRHRPSKQREIGTAAPKGPHTAPSPRTGFRHMRPLITPLRRPLLAGFFSAQWGPARTMGERRVLFSPLACFTIHRIAKKTRQLGAGSVHLIFGLLFLLIRSCPVRAFGRDRPGRKLFEQRLFVLIPRAPAQRAHQNQP